ncbi:MAG: PspC domain-containing protein [Clostridiales bacterium]|nr:PspC domain-containing protein [Clostridiales bacterium]
MMNNRIYKSSRDKVLAGVCGGVAEYFNIDPVIVRLIWVIATLAGGAGLLVYIIAAIIMPQDGENNSMEREYDNYDSDKGKKILGIAFVLFGIFFISKNYLRWIDNEALIAVALIGVGVFLYMQNRGGKDEK